MKGIILAGGSATRLFPLTATTSKQLLPVYDRQMIFYPLNTLIKAGIKDILVIVAPEHSGQFLNLLGRIFDNSDINISFKVQTVPRGLAEAFILGEEFIDGDNVAMILGDNIFEDNLADDIANFVSGGMIFIAQVNDPSSYGVVELVNDEPVSIEEKPEVPRSNWCVTGLYVYDSSVVNVAKELEPSVRGELEITDINRHFLDKEKLTVNKLSGAWLDAGTITSLLEANITVCDREIYKSMHPMIDTAVAEFNDQLKLLARKVLKN